MIFDLMDRGMRLQPAQSIYATVLSELPADADLGIDTELWPLSADGSDWNRSYYLNWDGPRTRRAENAVLFIREGSYLNRGDSLNADPSSVIRNDPKGINHRLFLNCNTKQLINLMGRVTSAPVQGFAFSVYVPMTWREWCSMGSECWKKFIGIDKCSTNP